jgi:hypothetical protein
MAKEIILNINQTTTINAIVNKLIYDDDKDDITIKLSYEPGHFLKGEIFTVINAYIKHLESKKVICRFELLQNPCYSINYIARINFFKNINYPFVEDFNRHNTEGSLVEISEFNSKNMYDVVTRISYILSTVSDIDKDTINCVNYCLGELVANVEMHSKSNSNGLIYAQYFRNNILKIFIVDNGIGFYESFAENDEFNHLSEEDLLKKSLEEKFKSKNGGGQGYGLFHTKEFINLSEGILSINTCGKTLLSNKDYLSVINSNYWQGSIISLKFKTNCNVDYSQVFLANNDFYQPKIDLHELMEEYNNTNNEKLW